MEKFGTVWVAPLDECVLTAQWHTLRLAASMVVKTRSKFCETRVRLHWASHIS